MSVLIVSLKVLLSTWLQPAPVYETCHTSFPAKCTSVYERR